MITSDLISLTRNVAVFVLLGATLSGCLTERADNADNVSAFSDPAPNQAPTISGTPRTGVQVNSSYSFEPLASDADNDALTFSVTRMPGWARFDGASGRLSGTPIDSDVGVYADIIIGVSDGVRTAELAPFSITVTAVAAPNSPPVISGTPRGSVTAGNAYSFVPTATDIDNDVLTYSVSQSPLWATFDPATGVLSGRPDVADVGTYPNISISVSDGEFSASLPEFSITVSLATEPNTPPEISGTPATSIEANRPYSFTPTASDADGDSLIFSVSGLPVWASFNDTTGRLSGTPADSDVGVYSNIQISVSDGMTTADLAPFSVSVDAVVVSNTPPTISGSPPTSVDANSAYSFVPSANDSDGDSLAFSAAGIPVWANFSGATGRISGTPGDADVGVYPNIRISVSDGTATSDLAPFSITVNAVGSVNTPPVISGSPGTNVNANNAYSFTPTASDADGDSLTFSVTGLPGWANFNQGTGRVNGTPGDADVGSYPNIRISVSDGTASADLAPFSITVNAAGTPNTPPVISGTPPTNVDANSSYTFTPTASDTDGDSLTFSINGLPGWANFNQGTGRVNGTPGDADVGDYPNIRISVSDGTASVDLAAFSITVNAVVTPNTPPVISGAPPTSVDANSSYTFTPTASDADGDSLTFSVNGLPGWANFNQGTGRVNGTPGDADVGSYPNIRISVSDGTASADLAAFSITVNAVGTPNTPPVISGAPATSVDANSSYTFTPTASDADGDSLTFSINGLPGWANFNQETGRVNGTPGDADVGDYPNIRISVSDGTASVDLAAFSITVNAVVTPNTPPVISGAPQTSVEANSSYSFTPTASDADGDSLTFGVAGLPGWASFNTVTGRISGTPGDADVGVYSNIQVSVSDGDETADLAAFSIAVNAISLGSVTLSWTAPTNNVDGSPLLDLDRYRIYWGTVPGNYPNSVTFDANTTTYVIEDLPFGTYEFVATSINSAGVESAYSSPTTTTVSQ